MRFTSSILATLSLTLVSAQALDLTPKRAVRKGNEGPPTPVLQFEDGTTRLEFCPPAGWEASGGGNSLSFFTSEATSWMKLQVVPKTNPQLQNAANLSQDDLQKWAAQFLPARVEDVQFVKVVAAPYHLGQHLSTEFIFSYTFGGARSSISISFVDHDKDWLVLSVSAKAKDFEQVRQAAISSMFSWSEEG